MRTLLAPLLVGLLALPALATPDLTGSYDVIGQDGHGRYRGTATLTEDASGRVRGTLTVEYVRWSWTSRSYEGTSVFNAARVDARVSAGRLRGTRRRDAGLAGTISGSGPASSAIRYTIYEKAGKVTAIRGSYGQSWEQLHHHRAGATGLQALRAELEAATNGMLYMSESDRPFEWVALEGASASVHSLAEFKARLGVEASRPAEERTLQDTFGWRLEHQAGESPEEAADVDRYLALKALLEARLTDVKVYRVAEPGADDVSGAIDVYIIGRDADGNLAGLKTVAVET